MLLAWVPLGLRLGHALLVLLVAMQVEANAPRLGALVGGAYVYVWLMFASNRLVTPSLLLALQILVLYYYSNGETLTGDSGLDKAGLYSPFLALLAMVLLPAADSGDDRPLMAAYEREIRELFWKHDNARVHLVDQLLRENRGREQELLSSLRREYGEPDDPVKDALLRDLARSGSGGGGGGGGSSPVPQPSVEQIRLDIARLVQRHDQQHMPKLDRVLEKYAGRERELLLALCQDYKAPLPPYLAAAPPPTTYGKYKPWTLEEDRVLEEERLKAREAVRRNLGQVNAAAAAAGRVP